jgi:hypothetical protein
MQQWHQQLRFQLAGAMLLQLLLWVFAVGSKT